MFIWEPVNRVSFFSFNSNTDRWLVPLFMPLKIDDFLRAAISYGASDLHVKAGSFPFIRVGGELRPVVDAPRLTQEDTLDMAFSMMTNRQKQRFKEVSEVDIGYG